MIKFPADETDADVNPKLQGDSTPIPQTERHDSGPSPFQQSASVEKEESTEQLMVYEGHKKATTDFGWRYSQGTDVLVVTFLKIAYMPYAI